MPAPLTDDIATIEEVAAALGRTDGWLRRNWLRLHRAEGFPRKHPTGPTWPREAVRAWLRSGGFAPAAPHLANDNDGSVTPQAAFEAAFAERYGGQA